MTTSEEHWERLQHYIPQDPPLRFSAPPVLPRTGGVNGATVAGGLTAAPQPPLRMAANKTTEAPVR